MSALPAPLLKQLRQTLLDCGPFDSDRQLRAIFTADDRLAPWRNNLPEADSRAERVNLFVAEFLRRRNRQEQSVLVLFLQAVHEQAEEEDECHWRLNDLAVQVAAATGSALPPLARGNLARAAAAQSGVLPAALPGYAPPALAAEPGLLREPLPAGLPAAAFAERLESLKQKEKADWLPVGFLEKGLQAAYAVGRVEYHGRHIGTAFLVAPDLVLTNAHVMAEIPELPAGGVRFHVGLQTEPAWCYFAKKLIASPVQELDFALLQLQTAVPNARPISFSSEKAYPDQPANILQYPGIAGGMMQVALRYNAIVHVDPARFYYVTDTEEGSSGSPVFDDAWRVIGLHRAGMVDDAQRPVKGANQGVPITAVAPLIRPFLE